MAQTSSRSLLRPLEAVGVDVHEKAPKVSDEISLVYPVQGLERLTPPIPHPQAGVAGNLPGFPLVPPFPQASWRLKAGSKGARVLFIQNSSNVGGQPVNIGISQLDTGTYAPFALTAEWGGATRSVSESGSLDVIPPLVQVILQLPGAGESVNENQVPIPLYPGDILYTWGNAGLNEAFRCIWDEPV